MDTNVYLSFYSYNKFDLWSLDAFIKLIDEKDLQIILPDQVVNEFERNRMGKIYWTLNDFEKTNLAAIPRLFDSFPDEKSELKKMILEVNSKRSILIDKIKEEGKLKRLRVDELIYSLFDKSIKINLDDKIYSESVKRYNLWNPPWKDKSYWDAIIRETLLRYDLGNNNLQFISIDTDFVHIHEKWELHSFLDDEWQSQKWTKVVFYNDINLFFEANNLPMSIDDEYRKGKLIDSLSKSSSFDDTRLLFRKLLSYPVWWFSEDQVFRLLSISINNEQVYLAHQYDHKERIWDFLESLINEKLNYDHYNEVNIFDSLYWYSLIKDNDNFLPF